MTFGLDPEVIDCFVGDGRCDNLAVTDIDADVRGSRAFFDFDDGAFDLVACTDTPWRSPRVRPQAGRGSVLNDVRVRFC